MTCTVEARGLYKVYPGGVEAVKGVDITARSGRTSLMGPNGSGKTTTLSMIAGALKPTRGSVTVCGYDVWGAEWLDARRKIGYAPQDMPFRVRLSGMDNLVWYGLLKGLSLGEARRRARELAEVLDMGDYLGRSVASYSGGMRRRLSIAAAMMGYPEVLILDEPASGLDPRAREELWRLIEVTLKDVLVIYSTHIPEEAARHSNMVYIFNEGVVAASGSPEELISRYSPKPKIIVYTREDVEPIRVDGLEPQVISRGIYMYTVDDPSQGVRMIVDAYSIRGAPIERVETRKPGLEEVFFTVTGRRLEEVEA
ncbi:MAG: ABC transporter ATP-binding protein [Desulfurococcales archaeon]|nr:ABC transporter ATP-binding protein [Desulfurococcales archaeon]